MRPILLDANILYPASLRDLFLQLAVDGLIAVRWTEAIQTEWIEALLRNEPRYNRERLELTRRAMDQAILDCLVTGYEHLVPDLILPDTNDRHVLAAAIVGQCSAIITRNISDFPETIVAAYKIEIIHPDRFVAALILEQPVAVARSIRAIRSRLTNPPYAVSGYLAILAAQELSESTTILRNLTESL